MRRFRVSSALLVLLAAAGSGGGIAVGCSAAGERHEFGVGGEGGATSTTTGSSGGHGGAAAGGGGDGEGAGFVIPDAGPEDANPDVIINPCGSECGPTELCDDQHLGLDDDCDGFVDETCACATGQAHSCFKGDPSYRNAMGCFPGTERCDESGSWGPCLGGVHATDNCATATGLGCHPIQASPFADVDLKDGTGTFSSDAVAGSEVWTVTCPAGVDPCPGVAGMNPVDDFKPLQSGEYTVTYTKGLPGGGTDSCTYPLFVGAPGLRVELEWEHDLGGTGVDLDLHLHRPNNTQPWAVLGSNEDCGWNNCTASGFEFSFAPLTWFSDMGAPPTPLNWYLDPVMAKNTCFYAPRGAGQTWQDNGRGCHNPRLDIDNYLCEPGVTDPNNDSFCAPENVNVDFPPKNQWFRVAIHYYSNRTLTYSVHPRVKVFCNGALSADLGEAGFNAPITLAPADSTKFWLVADVMFKDGGECGTDECIVAPLYQDAATRAPLFMTAEAAEASFGPAYPPAP